MVDKLADAWLDIRRSTGATNGGEPTPLKRAREVKKLVDRYPAVTFDPLPSRVDGVVTLYKMWNAENECLYVGTTYILGTCLRSYSREKWWWGEVTTISIQEYPNHSLTRYQLEELEYEQIRKERPLYNVRGNTNNKE